MFKVIILLILFSSQNQKLVEFMRKKVGRPQNVDEVIRENK
jgi:hypothetical protein